MSNQPICFVITGFGMKTDYQTGKSYNLDLSFKELIKPVFEKLGFLCLRTIELSYSGNIEKKMYEYIMKADFVVADLSTLNPNAFYELGVRHALKPYTTIMIGESSLFGDKSKNLPSRLPFDLNHYVILSYEHLGNKIATKTKNSFHKQLEHLILELKDKNEQDSPVFDHLDLSGKLSSTEIASIKEDMSATDSLQAILENAEKLKNENKLEEALIEFKKAKEIASKYEYNNSEHIIQRIALCTYKSKPNDVNALNEALKILEPLNPNESINTETLGLAGAIHKRLFDKTNAMEHAEMASKMYNKGFYINDDYYTGINAAFMQNVIGKNSDNESFYKQLANYTRNQVLKITNNLIKTDNFYKRDDVQWILQTKAEAEYMLDNEVDYQKTLIKLEDMNIQFNKTSFEEQMAKLNTMK